MISNDSSVFTSTSYVMCDSLYYEFKVGREFLDCCFCSEDQTKWETSAHTLPCVREYYREDDFGVESRNFGSLDGIFEYDRKRTITVN
ncbi:hypothetical protein J6590_015168 [Homalodisca vitripennis]|nr:hypothetical protein J6590_015168 [Homalodisca vitripennis]